MSIFFAIYSIFAIICFCPKKNSKIPFVEIAIFVNLFSLVLSSYAVKGVYLFLIILGQFVSFWASALGTKTLSSQAYKIAFIAQIIFFFISLTCSFGYYYVNIGLIDTSGFIYFNSKNFLVSKIANFVIDYLYVFWNTLPYYLLKEPSEVAVRAQLLVFGGFLFALKQLFSKMMTHFEQNNSNA